MQVVAELYGRIHVPPLPQVRSLAECTSRWTRRPAAPPPQRPDTASTRGAGDHSRPGSGHRSRHHRPLIHGDLHYENVLAAEREPWLVIDPKPMNGDPHYEVAPMLWNRWDELAGYVRDGVRRRLSALVDASGLDADRARAWVIVRMVHNAMWELTETPEPDADWLTRML